MALIADWRASLVTHLAAAFPAAEVRGGRRQGVSRDKDRINVFAGSPAYRRNPERAVVANPVMVVRYWKQHSKQPRSTSPPDPTELEDAAMSLITSLRTVQASLAVTNLWYFLVDGFDVDDDPEEWGVETTLLGFAKNLAAVA